MLSNPLTDETIKFINKNLQKYLKSLSQKNIQQLFNKFVLKQTQKNKNNDINKIEISSQNFKKVASQVQFLGYDKDYCMIFCIYGPKIDCNHKEQLLFVLNQIIEESFYPSSNHSTSIPYKKHSTQGITILFFNNIVITKKKKHNFFSSKQIFTPIKFDQFKTQVIKQLPLKYLTKINNIIVLYPSMLTKSWNYLTSFGVENGFFDNYFHCLDTVYELVEFLGPLFNIEKVDGKILAYSGENNLALNNKSQKNWKMIYTEYQRARSTNQFQSYQKLCQQTSSNTNYKAKFVYKSTLSQYKIDKQNHMPLMLTILFNQIQQRHLKYQGIFRKVAQQRELMKFQNFIYDEIQCQEDQKQIKQSLQKYLPQFQIENITSFIKKFFINLGDKELITEEIYLNFIKIQEQKDRRIESQNNIAIKIKNEENLYEQKNNQNQKSTQIQSKNNLALSTIQQNIPENRSRQNFLSKLAFFQNMTSQNNSKMNQSSNKNNIQPKIKFNKVQGNKKTPKQPVKQNFNKNLLIFGKMKEKSLVNYMTLKRTVELLNKIYKNQKFNLMSSRNLAICFVPCFFSKFTSAENKNLLSPEPINMHESLRKQCFLNSLLVDAFQKLISKPEDYFD